MPPSPAAKSDAISLLDRRDDLQAEGSDARRRRPVVEQVCGGYDPEPLPEVSSLEERSPISLTRGSAA
jgi:hypothetical protein